MELLQHKHLMIRAEVENPPTDAAYMQTEWFPNLIRSIGMDVLMGPYTVYFDEVEGNRGFTGVAIIKTSHIAMHTWDECSPGLLQLDVYTCGCLDPYDVIESIKEFNPTKIEMKYLDREHGFTELPLPIQDENDE